MIKSLETAIEKIKRLPPERQAYVAHVLDEIAVLEGEQFRVPDEHRAAVLEALEQATRGERAPAEAVDEVLRKPWA